MHSSANKHFILFKFNKHHGKETKYHQYWFDLMLLTLLILFHITQTIDFNIDIFIHFASKTNCLRSMPKRLKRENLCKADNDWWYNLVASFSARATLRELHHVAWSEIRINDSDTWIMPFNSLGTFKYIFLMFLCNCFGRLRNNCLVMN